MYSHMLFKFMLGSLFSHFLLCPRIDQLFLTKIKTHHDEISFWKGLQGTSMIKRTRINKCKIDTFFELLVGLTQDFKCLAVNQSVPWQTYSMKRCCLIKGRLKCIYNLFNF